MSSWTVTSIAEYVITRLEMDIVSKKLSSSKERSHPAEAQLWPINCAQGSISGKLDPINYALGPISGKKYKLHM